MATSSQRERFAKTASTTSEPNAASLANLIADANGELLKSEGYFLMQTIRGRASLDLYLRYRGRHIEQTAQIL